MTVSSNRSVALVAILAAVLALGGGRSERGQPASLQGYVTDAQSGHPLPQAHVRVQGTATGTTTDEDGRYVLQKLASGTQVITVSYVGYRPQTLTVTLEAGTDRRLDVALVPADLEVGKLTVRQHRNSPGPRTHRLRAADLERLPPALGDDIFRSLSLLPGVTTTSDYSSQLHVRGGGPSQTLVRLDGRTVFKPTHLFGLFSMFNPDAVGTVELHKGPYPVEYGGRLGSVIDVQSRSGNRHRVAGGLTLSLTASRAYVGGPIGTRSSPAGSYLVAARRSTFDPLLSALQNVDTEGIPKGLSFYDANAHLTLTPSPNDELSFSLYGAHNGFDLHLHQDRVRFDIEYANRGFNATWNHRFGPDLSASVSFLGSKYHNEPVVNSGEDHFEEENELAELALDANVEYAPGKHHTLKGGLQAQRGHFMLRNHRIDRRRDRRRAGWARTVSGVSVESYVQDTYRPTRRWSLRGGLRGIYYQRGAFWRFSPRLSVAYRPTRSLQLQAAYSRNHQFRLIDEDSRLPGFDTWLVAGEGVPPADGHQVSTGTTVQVGEHWHLEAAGYYRVMNALFELKPWLTSYELADLPYEERFRFGNGRAYGGEFSLQRQDGAVTGFLSYTIGRTERTFPHPRPFVESNYHVANHDRTHEIEVVARWRLSQAWTVTGQFSYKTGRPYTPNVEDPILGNPFPSQSRQVPRQINTARLPAYHRMDLGTEKTGDISGAVDYKLAAKIVNVYSRENIWLYNYEWKNGVRVREDIPQFPVPIPYVSLSLHF